MWSNLIPCWTYEFITACPTLHFVRQCRQTLLKGYSTNGMTTMSTSTSVKGTDVYPHMPILRPHAVRYIGNVFKFYERCINGASLAWSLRRPISTVMLTCGWAWPARWHFRPILGFWVSKVHKIVIPCLRRRWTAEQNVTPLALSSVEKSVSVQTHTKNNSN